jgi:hypothetical protein
MHDGFPHEGRFRWVRRQRHPLGQRRQFLAGQLPFGIQPVCEADDFRLFSGRQILNLLDDLGGGHVKILHAPAGEFKPDVELGPLVRELPEAQKYLNRLLLLAIVAQKN